MNMEQKIDGILNTLTSNKKETEEKIDGILNTLTSNKKETEQKIDGILNTLTSNKKETEEKFDVVLTRIDKMQDELTLTRKDVSNLRKDVDGLNRTVTLMEHEHGEKIRALFDYIEVNKDEHKKLTELSLSIKSEIQGVLFNHEKRIKNLENNLVTNF